MKEWRKLTKKQLIHLIETMHDDKDIEKSIRKTREGQHRTMDRLGTREVCWDCKQIAVKVGIEEW